MQLQHWTRYKAFSFVFVHRGLTCLPPPLLILCAFLNEFDPVFNDSFTASYIFKIHWRETITLLRFMQYLISLQFPFSQGENVGGNVGGKSQDPCSQY